MLQTNYIRVSLGGSILFFAMGLALVALLACSGGGGNEPNNGSSGIVDGEWPFDASGEALEPTKGLEDMDLSNVIKIEYKNGSAPVITNDHSEEVTITNTGANVVVTIPNTTNTEYNFVLSGTTTNGSLKFYGNVKKTLYLNGVSITNSNGPAINIQKSGRIYVHLINGTKNFLTDGKDYSNIPEGEQAKGTFFSEGKLHFDGSGSLEVKGKYNHAIVADNDIEISNGEIIVSEAANDGIHANDKIQIKGGYLKIISVGDAIQSEKDLNIIDISGGKIKALTSGIKSHGIASEGPVSISDKAIVQISTLGNGSKGIRSRGWVEFKGGKTSIKTSGTKHTDPKDPEDESNSAGIKLAKDLFIEGGELTVKTFGNGAKGINTDGSATISSGKIDIDADDDGLRVHGTLKIEGGSGKIKSKKKKAINAESWDGTKGSITTQDSGGS